MGSNRTGHVYLEIFIWQLKSFLEVRKNIYIYINYKGYLVAVILSPSAIQQIFTKGQHPVKNYARDRKITRT